MASNTKATSGPHTVFLDMINLRQMDESGKTFLDGPRLEGGNYLSFISIFS
jgi:hypothetical protein